MHMNQANLRLKLQRIGAYQWPLDLQLTDQAEADIKATAHQWHKNKGTTLRSMDPSNIDGLDSWNKTEENDQT